MRQMLVPTRHHWIRYSSCEWCDLSRSNLRTQWEEVLLRVFRRPCKNISSHCVHYISYLVRFFNGMLLIFYQFWEEDPIKSGSSEQRVRQSEWRWFVTFGLFVFLVVEMCTGKIWIYIYMYFQILILVINCFLYDLYYKNIKL